MTKTRLSFRFCSIFLISVAALLFSTGCFWGGSSRSDQGREREGPTTRVEPDLDSFALSDAALTEAALNPRLPGKEGGEDPGSLYYLADPADDSFALDGFETENTVRSPVESSWTPSEAPVVSPPTQESPTPTPEAPPDRLAEARKRKEKAFERYTRLVTSGGEGDVQAALREYREALARLKELEGR